MKKISKLGCFLFASLAFTVLLFSACEEEVITTETYSFPDVYVALIKVSPEDIVALSDITIEGNDLNYVKTVRFWNDDDQVDVPKSDFKLHKNDSIVVNVPENAPMGRDSIGTPLGKISIITDDDKIITWVRGLNDKPVSLLDVTPDIVAPGDLITLHGGNFDLVKAVHFSKGENSAVVQKINFESVSLEDSTIVVKIPAGAPVEKVAVITDFDQMIVWEGALTGRTVSIVDFSPKGTVVVGTDVTVEVTNIDLVKSIAFGTNAATYTVNEEDNLLVITIPNSIAEGTYALNINTWNGVVKVADFNIMRLFLEPVWDLNHIFFDLDGKDSWWGNGTIENDPDYSISGSYWHVQETAPSPNDYWAILFRNAGNNLNVSRVTANDWVLKYDINVLGNAIPSIKIQLGDFYYITGVQPNIGGWYTMTVPLTNLKDNWGWGDPMTDAAIAALASSGDFGFIDGGAGGEYNVLIDNVRFESKTPYTEPIADPAYVYFDFDGKGSWWGDCPQTVENDPAYSISGSYFHIKATAAAGWYGLFWRNNGNDLNTSGLTVNNWAVKYDINVLGDNITSLKVRLGNFWYITDVQPNIGGWYTYMAPLSDFKDDDGKGKAMTDADIATWATAGDFGFADGGKGGEYDVLIDNVRFEPK